MVGLWDNQSGFDRDYEMVVVGDVTSAPVGPWDTRVTFSATIAEGLEFRIWHVLPNGGVATLLNFLVPGARLRAKGHITTSLMKEGDRRHIEICDLVFLLDDDTRALEKQAQRDDDLERIRTGETTRHAMASENSFFSGLRLTNLKIVAIGDQPIGDIP